MKIVPIALAVCAFLATFISPSAAQTVVGSGSSSTFVVIEASAFGTPLFYEYQYTYSVASPLDTYTILTAIDLAVDELQIDFINYGTPSAPNYFVDEITFADISLSFDGDNFWAQWVAGGRTSFTDFETSQTTFFDAPAGEWSFGNGIADPFRLDAPGSWDGLIFNEGDVPPSIAPIPEPGTIALLALTGLSILTIQRRRHA